MVTEVNDEIQSVSVFLNISYETKKNGNEILCLST